MAATPPAISRVDTPRSVAARTAFMVSTSATASWKPAATSAGEKSASTPCFSRYRATAVLSPEKLKLCLASRGPVMPRGNGTADESPCCASSSSTLPPG
ncbi:Uncharacterised protein [Mycobacteroides abscessus subsp. abscessus]|nr:Uncharacterised protein [Mycobacteroides abscessus subsp. abscessus]